MCLNTHTQTEHTCAELLKNLSSPKKKNSIRYIHCRKVRTLSQSRHTCKFYVNRSFFFTLSQKYAHLWLSSYPFGTNDNET